MGRLRGKRPHQKDSLGRLRELRARRGWTQHDLARESGVSTLTISRAENGRRLHAPTMFHLADALDVDPREMLTRDEVMDV